MSLQDVAQCVMQYNLAGKWFRKKHSPEASAGLLHAFLYFLYLFLWDFKNEGAEKSISFFSTSLTSLPSARQGRLAKLVCRLLFSVIPSLLECEN